MIKEKQYLEAQKIVNEWNSQVNKSRVIPRYFVDIRGGCGAVRDKWHESYDKDYPGLHIDTPDVVEYKNGYTDNGTWVMKQVDIDYLNNLCELLNNQVQQSITEECVDSKKFVRCFDCELTACENHEKCLKDKIR